MSQKHRIVLELEMLPGAEHQATATLTALAHACIDDMACFELPGFKVVDLQLGNDKPPSRDTHAFKTRANNRRVV